jgi:long-subunit acyl-CoA synthetase (AMP-forming)
VSLKTELNLDTGIPSDKLTGDALDTSKEIGSSATTLTDAAKDPKWKEYIDAGMKIANANTTSAAQKVQKYAWLPKDFCEADGDLTPTLKLKRSVVAKKYVDLIDSIYGESVE